MFSLPVFSWSVRHSASIRYYYLLAVAKTKQKTNRQSQHCPKGMCKSPISILKKISLNKPNTVPSILSTGWLYSRHLTNLTKNGTEYEFARGKTSGSKIFTTIWMGFKAWEVKDSCSEEQEPLCFGWFLLLLFLSTWHKLELFKKLTRQMRKCFH